MPRPTDKPSKQDKRQRKNALRAKFPKLPAKALDEALDENDDDLTLEVSANRLIAWLRDRPKQ